MLANSSGVRFRRESSSPLLPQIQSRMLRTLRRPMISSNGVMLIREVSGPTTCSGEK